MDFMNRGAQAPRGAHEDNNPAGASANNGGKKTKRWSKSPTWVRAVTVLLLFSVAGLVVAVAVWLWNSNKLSEAQYVNPAKYQAVFLTNNQVYFGKVKNV